MHLLHAVLCVRGCLRFHFIQNRTYATLTCLIKLYLSNHHRYTNAILLTINALNDYKIFIYLFVLVEGENYLRGEKGTDCPFYSGNVFMEGRKSFILPCRNDKVPGHLSFMNANYPAP